MLEKNKAWKLLTTDEQMAITLSLSHGKSSWEIGEIMGKSHYKLLEIMARGKRFFKLFGEYFDEHGQLFPEGCSVDVDFQFFMEKAILDRLPLKKINNIIGNPNFIDNRKRAREIEKGMKSIKSQKAHDLYDLIIEFDRWNNYRVLPESIQEPSAFKRRNKTREKNRLKLVSDLPDLTIDIIRKRFETKGKGQAGVIFLPIIDRKLKSKKDILRVSNEKINITTLSYLGFYVFRDYNQSLEYIDLVKEFIFNEEVTCKKGLVFWPQFRVLSSKALNYNRLENIKTNRKYFEKMVGIDDRELIRRRKEGSKKSKKAKRVKKVI